MGFPRFDKGAHDGQGDRHSDLEHRPCDFLIFEGWFNGFRPILTDGEGLSSESPLVTDNSRLFRLNNPQLAAYEPIWDTFDELIILKPEQFSFSFDWRAQAEAKLASGMSPAQVREFVQYFLNCLPPDAYFRQILNDRPRFRNHVILEISFERELQQIL